MSQPPRAEGEKAKDRWADLPQVDVEKMDYEYVGKCEDAKELLDIYTVLTSGKEGRYFDLEKYTEERMLKFMAPKERKLWLARRRTAAARRPRLRCRRCRAAAAGPQAAGTPAHSARQG